MPEIKSPSTRAACQAVVLWIDWYAYHFARFAGLQSAFGANGEVRGIELVGGVGVHDGLQFREGVPEGLPVETLQPHSSWRKAGKLRLAFGVWRRLSALKPELVLVPGYYTLPAIAAAVWCKLHSRVSVLMTESTAADHQRTAWKETLKSVVIRSLFDWATTGGAPHRRYLHDLRFPAERIVNFYDVVDNESLAARVAGLRERGSAAFDLPSPYFLYVGRLAEEKNVAGLIDSWTAYREQGGTWPLVIAGDGPEGGGLRAKAADSAFAADIIFAGHKRSEDLPLFYAFAGCFVLPSTREPWGLVVNEAMACSLPVIVSTRCGCAEDLVLNHANGLTFNPSDMAQLTKSLEHIARQTPERLARMGRSSASRICTFSPANFGREIQSVAERSRRPRNRRLSATSVPPSPQSVNQTSYRSRSSDVEV